MKGTTYSIGKIGGERDLKTVTKNDFIKKNADFRTTPARFNQEEATGKKNDNLVPSIDIGPNVAAVRGSDSLPEHFTRGKSSYTNAVCGKYTD